jgi:predicted transcriptional regulator YdeE
MVKEVFDEHKLSERFGLRLISERNEMLLVGMVSSGNIAELWNRFMAKENLIKHRVEGAWWELHTHEHYSVMAGVEVTRVEAVPDEMFVKPIPAGKYAVFPHHPGLGEPNHGYDALNKRIDGWLDSGPYRIARRFSLQLYDSRFKGMEDPASEQDLLIPIEPK